MRRRGWLMLLVLAVMLGYVLGWMHGRLAWIGDSSTTEPPDVSAGVLWRIDPNRASAEQLERLPGIGPALSGRILADRQENGFYRKADDLLRVQGIGPAMLRRIHQHLDFEE